MGKVALFVDWDNVRNTIENIQRSLHFRKFNFNDPRHLLWFLRSYLEPDEKIYRIYFYTAKMLRIDEIEAMTEAKDSSKLRDFLENRSAHYNRKVALSDRFLETIAQQEYVALRLGRLSFRGFIKNRGNYEPLTVQKEVDMLFGLDISHIAYLRLADKVLLFSKDTDIVPAMKVARINGLEVILPILEQSGAIAPKLLKHSDIVRKRSLLKIYAQMLQSR